MCRTTDRASRLWALATIAVAWSGVAGEAQAQILRDTYLGDDDEPLGTVRAAGDIDQDGKNDYLIGSELADPDGDGAQGQVTLYSGATGLAVTTFSATVPGIHGFGYSMAGNGDYDGDGVPDVLIGSYGEILTLLDPGSIDIYSGVSYANLLHLDGSASGQMFGWSVDFVGDLDGDGDDEFIVGAPGADYADVYDGGTGVLLYSMSGQSGDNDFGKCVRRAGDVNADGVEDFIVGEPFWDLYIKGVLMAQDAGRAVVYSGADGQFMVSFAGLTPNIEFGASVGGLGDVDADGHAEVIVGAPGEAGVGSATIYSGGNAGALYTVWGAGTLDQFGRSVSTLGDVSGDGVPDFAVGAPGYNPADMTALARGYVRTFNGATGTLAFTFFPTTGVMGYGTEVSGADFNGDGYGDWMLSFPDSNSEDGLVEVWLGNPAQWSKYGTGWPGTFGIPDFTIGGDPAPDHTITLQVANSAGMDTVALLLLGFDDAAIPTSAGGTLLVDPILIQPYALSAAAGLSIDVTIPGDDTLIGLDFFLQALEADAGASKKISFTGGVRVHIGFAYP